MNVASLLLDSPSDDRERRLQRHTQPSSEQHQQQPLQRSPSDHPTSPTHQQQQQQHPPPHRSHSRSQSGSGAHSPNITPPLYSPHPNNNVQRQHVPSLPTTHQHPHHSPPSSLHASPPPPAFMMGMPGKDRERPNQPSPSILGSPDRDGGITRRPETISIIDAERDREIDAERRRGGEREMDRMSYTKEKQREKHRERERKERRESSRDHHQQQHSSPPSSVSQVQGGIGIGNPHVGNGLNAGATVPESLPAIPVQHRHSPNNLSSASDHIPSVTASATTPVSTMDGAATATSTTTAVVAPPNPTLPSTPFEDYNTNSMSSRPPHPSQPAFGHHGFPNLQPFPNSASVASNHISSSVNHHSKRKSSRRERDRERRRDETGWEGRVAPATTEPDYKSKLQKYPDDPVSNVPGQIAYNLGTFVFPASPFPLRRSSFPADLIPSATHRHHRRSEPLIHFTVCIPSTHLPTTELVASTATRALLWGGYPYPYPATTTTPSRRIYTDDSYLPLIPLHTGQISLAECKRPRGDLKLLCGVVPKWSRSYPIRWAGCVTETAGSSSKSGEPRMGVHSWSWGNGHDGHGVEVLKVEWVKHRQSHRLYLPNRRARLKEYAERRRVLMPSSLAMSSVLNADPYRFESHELELVSDVYRWTSGGQFKLVHVGSDDGLVDDLVNFKRTRGDADMKAVVFSSDGCPSFKYTPASLSEVLFPPPPNMDDKFADLNFYYIDRERPRKKRKTNGRQGSAEFSTERVLEVFGSGKEVLVFRLAKPEEDGGREQHRWDVWIEGDDGEGVFEKSKVEEHCDALKENTNPDEVSEKQSIDDNTTEKQQVPENQTSGGETGSEQLSNSNAESAAMSISSPSTPRHISPIQLPQPLAVTESPVDEKILEETPEKTQEDKLNDMARYKFSAAGLRETNISFEESGVCLWGAFADQLKGVAPESAEGETGILFKANRWKWRTSPQLDLV